MDEEIRSTARRTSGNRSSKRVLTPWPLAIEWPGTTHGTVPDHSSMFDADGKCTEPFCAEPTAPNGIESLVLTFYRRTCLHGRSRRFRFPICSTSAPPRRAPPMRFSRASGFRWATSLRGATSKQFDIAGQIPMLYADPGSGRHPHLRLHADRRQKGPLDLGGAPPRGQQEFGKADRCLAGARPHPAARDLRR